MKGGGCVGLYLLRTLVVLVGGWAGGIIGLTQGGEYSGTIGTLLGAGCGIGLCLLERLLRRIPLQSYLYAFGGLLLGLLFGGVGNYLLDKVPIHNPVVLQAVSLMIYAVCAYFGIVLGLGKGPNWPGGRTV